MEYYLKFHMYGEFPNSEPGYTVDTINLYNENTLVNLTLDNVVSHDWRNRTYTLESIFSTSYIGHKSSPYQSNKNGYCDLIIKLNNKVNKLFIKAYQNIGSCKRVDIYFSSDNEDYTLISNIEFSRPSDEKTIDLKIPYIYYLLFQNNKYFDVSNENYDLIEKKYNNLNITVDKDIQTLFIERNFQMCDLFTNKQLNDESFLPINKFSEFKIRKLISKK